MSEQVELLREGGWPVGASRPSPADPKERIVRQDYDSDTLAGPSPAPKETLLMCYGCWEEEGAPRIDTPAVRAAALAVAEVYEHSCVGGNLHIVLDDWNLEDGSLEFCDGCINGAGAMPLRDDAADFHKRYNDEKRANPDPPDQLAAERRCHDLFKALTVKERAAALALNDGFWSFELPKEPT